MIPANYKPAECLYKHKVRLFIDRHGRPVSKQLINKLSDSYDISAMDLPGITAKIITEVIKNNHEVKTLNFDNTVVLSTESNDCGGRSG